MLLSARMLDSVGSVNIFEYVDQVSFMEGDTVDLFFQLIDLSKDKAINQFKPAGRRYIPVAGATMSVVLDNIDDDIKVTRVATQPFAGDPSIWKVSVLASDKIRGTVALSITLTESGVVKRGRVETAVAISPSGTL